MKHVISRYILMTWPGCCRVALEWRNLADLAWRSGSHRGSGRRCTSDTGQLCRCGPTLHRRGRGAGCWCYARSRGWSAGSWRYARSRGRGTGPWRCAREPRWTREQSRGALNAEVFLSCRPRGRKIQFDNPAEFSM